MLLFNVAFYVGSIAPAGTAILFWILLHFSPYEQGKPTHDACRATGPTMKSLEFFVDLSCPPIDAFFWRLSGHIWTYKRASQPLSYIVAPRSLPPPHHHQHDPCNKIHIHFHRPNVSPPCYAVAQAFPRQQGPLLSSTALLSSDQGIPTLWWLQTTLLKNHNNHDQILLYSCPPQLHLHVILFRRLHLDNLTFNNLGTPPPPTGHLLSTFQSLSIPSLRPPWPRQPSHFVCVWCLCCWVTKVYAQIGTTNKFFNV